MRRETEKVKPGLVVGAPDASQEALGPREHQIRIWTAGLLGAALLLLVLSGSGAGAFALGEPRTIPTMLAAGLLAVASGFAWLLGRSPGRRGSHTMRAWWVVAALLALLAIEQATSLHAWAAEWGGLPRFSMLEFPVIIGVVAVVIGSRLLPLGRSRDLWIAGGATWLGAQVAEVALGGRWQHAASASVEFVGCGLILLALLRALPPESMWSEAWNGRGGLSRLVESTVGAVTVKAAAQVLFAAIGLFALFGALVILLDLEIFGSPGLASNPLSWFDLNQELTFPAHFSGAMLAVMAGLSLLVARTPNVRVGSAWPWLAMAVIVAYLALDEVVDFHGRLQNALDTEAQVFLAPLIACAAVVGLVLLVRIWPNRPVRWMFLGGAGAWGLAMAIDPSTHPGAVLAYPEELLEMTGSALFLLALLSLARDGLGSGGDAVPPEPDPVV